MNHIVVFFSLRKMMSSNIFSLLDLFIYLFIRRFICYLTETHATHLLTSYTKRERERERETEEEEEEKRRHPRFIYLPYQG